ncbi:MAG: M20/M25/M40 family metallo-hydrolase [Acidobacteriota bacterium]
MKPNIRPAARFLLVLLLLVAGASCAKTPRDVAAFDRAVDGLFAQGSPLELETYFCSLGTNPELGFRWAGTTAERAAGTRAAAEMRAAGLVNVRLESVPVDVFEFKSASLTVGGRVMTASTAGGVPPTPAAGVTAPVVYAKGGTAADFDAAGDVAGKLVLLDLKLSSWWLSLPAFEAGRRRAAGVICTFTPDDPAYFSVNERALGSFDGQYDLAAPPWIYVSRADGDRLKAGLKAGPVTATMILAEKVTLTRDGGLAYNVVGELPGSRPDGRMILVAAHPDALFRAGADDTGGLVNMLTVAKAMRAADFRPKTTIVFLATAGEECGYTNAYYDWITGAWWAAVHAHPDWAGRVKAMINFETMAVKGAPLALRSTPELKPWLEKLAAKNARLLPHKTEFLTPVNSWNDQWTFTAAGIPSLKLGTTNEGYDKLYHSNFETSDLVDWDYMAKIAKFAFRAVLRLDDGLLPYSLKARAEDLGSAVKADELVGAGAAAASVSRLAAALTAFREAAAAFESAAGSIPAARIEAANGSLLSIEKALNGGLTAISPADDDATVYPHQPALGNAQGINGALAALRAAKPDRAAALKALAGTSLTRLGLAFSLPVYQKQLGRLDPSFDRITWAAQGHLAKPLDVLPEYRKIEAGDYAGAIAGLEAKRRVEISRLEERLAAMAGLLESVTPRLKTLAGRK